jgi:ketosteroid isomerase-like protein
MRFLFKASLAVILLGSSSSISDGQPLAKNTQTIADSGSAAVQKTIDGFIEAFTNLEWERFRGFFAADATAFFPPSAKFPRRANGKAEIENVFRNVFGAARERKSSPPYLSIHPKEMKIQVFGRVAIVTFHLEDPDLLGRRTIVFQKTGRRWLIVHIHASGTSVH